MPNSMKSGLQLRPPGRNGCGNPRPRGRKVKSAPFHTLPWMVRGRRSTPHPTWLHHHGSPFSFLVALWIRQRIKCEEPRGHTCTLMSGPRCMERSSLPHQDDSPPVIWGIVMLGYPGGASGKEPACLHRRCKTYGSIPGSGRSPQGGHGYPLQCSCLDNPRDRGSWWATVNRGAKSQTRPCTHIYKMKNHRHKPLVLFPEQDLINILFCSS